MLKRSINFSAPVFFTIIFIQFSACQHRTSDRVETHLYNSIPSPERNPISDYGLKLGHKLFFDSRLSSNGKVSCATCHQPKKAFSDGLSLSLAGVSGQVLKRHVPALINLAWQKAYFWDGGANDLESQVFGPLRHADEMGKNLDDLVKELNADKGYREAFKRAFGVDSISSAYITRALAQYERSLISINSTYDQYQRGEVVLNDLALEGLSIFRSKCTSCHSEDLFTDGGYHNIGLDTIFSEVNMGIGQGRFRITKVSTDMGAYKTPSLRNIAVTAPYMHDGRFASLKDVF